MHRSPFCAGMLAVMPLIPGMLPFGMITGMAAVHAGMPPITAQLSSLILMAGASQIAVSSLISSHTLPLMVILTIWIINLRFMMYSAALSAHQLKLNGPMRLLCAYLLTDQSYAVSHLHFEQHPLSAKEKTLFFLGTGFPLWLFWQLSTGVGIFFGQAVPQSWGLDLAVPLCFLSLLIPALRNRPSVLAAVVGGTLSVLLHQMPYNLGLLIAAVCGIFSGFFAERYLGQGSGQEVVS
ncbi:AzlC family ABC transporter permease [Dongshaea marina]|uniref:AzlC family ABC transporter permease n=1 Tax=Dongshaea marina TaxID=2047966 RepID=UPI000D3EA738|nr:AzlC family ABC transporter permease [Dongshaea marina]